MKKKLLLLSFIEGGAVMAAELCGAKLLAPVFGSSLFVWASVMGITLAALASGYFYGGWITQRSGDIGKTLFRILSAAALFILLMPVLTYYVVPWISYLPFLPGVVASTFLLLFPAVFFLGASSPLFISAQTGEPNLAGKVSGIVYAVSTAGGIVTTFLCGFYLIPEIGLNACLIFFGGLLFVANFIVFRFFRPAHFFLFAAFAYLNFQFGFKNEGQLLVSESILGRLEVQDVKNETKKITRYLSVNKIIQTEMDLKTGKSVSDYVVLLDSLIPFVNEEKSALVLGLGGGLTANLLEQKNYRTDGVEFDERIIAAASDFFFLDKRVNAVYSDARYFLNTCKKKYDVVLVDVFKAEEQPSHVITLESLQKLKSNLTDNGIVFVNWHGYLSGKQGLGSRILYNTLKQGGFKVKLYSTSEDENHRNIIFVAFRSGFSKTQFQLDEPFEETDLVNTDNHPLLEKYNAAANKAWRSNYLRYYQNKK
jgi:spermidine synthase